MMEIILKKINIKILKFGEYKECEEGYKECEESSYSSYTTSSHYLYL